MMSYYLLFIHQITELLTFDPGTLPIVKRTSKGEFLVNAGTFGVIAVANGISNVSHMHIDHTTLEIFVFIPPLNIIFSAPRWSGQKRPPEMQHTSFHT